jgi:hypothetical protein
MGFSCVLRWLAEHREGAPRAAGSCAARVVVLNLRLSLTG